MTYHLTFLLSCPRYAYRILDGTDRGAWYHPNFLRGRPNEVNTITIKSKKVDAEQGFLDWRLNAKLNTPNFYDMPPIEVEDCRDCSNSCFAEKIATSTTSSSEVVSVSSKSASKVKFVAKDIHSTSTTTKMEEYQCNQAMPNTTNAMSKRAKAAKLASSTTTKTCSTYYPTPNLPLPPPKMSSFSVPTTNTGHFSNHQTDPNVQYRLLNSHPFSGINSVPMPLHLCFAEETSSPTEDEDEDEFAQLIGRVIKEPM